MLMCIQLNFRLLVAALCVTGLLACEREDYYVIEDTPVDEPVEIDVFNGFAFQAYNGDEIITEGAARRLNTGPDDSYTMVLTSGAVVCDGPNGYSTTSDGDQYFNIAFVAAADGEYYPYLGILTTEVEGQLMTLHSLVPAGSGCPQNIAEITIEELTDDHVTGTYTASFFRFGETIDDSLPCNGFEYVGEFTAEFSLPYEVCQ